MGPNALLFDTLGRFLRECELLLDLVFQKMKSNLVFVLEFLRLLAKRELLEYNV
jgi:predicted ATPase